jgi:hypothetical protein
MRSNNSNNNNASMSSLTGRRKRENERDSKEKNAAHLFFSYLVASEKTQLFSLSLPPPLCTHTQKTRRNVAQPVPAAGHVARDAASAQGKRG